MRVVIKLLRRLADDLEGIDQNEMDYSPVEYTVIVNATLVLQYLVELLLTKK